MATNPRRGEIYWINWSPGRGSEQAGIRPAVVVSTDMGNTNPRYPNAIVACMTTKGRDDIVSNVRLEPTSGNGLKDVTHVKCEQLMTISKDRLQDKFGSVDAADLDSIDAALKKVLALV